MPESSNASAIGRVTGYLICSFYVQLIDDSTVDYSTIDAYIMIDRRTLLRLRLSIELSAVDQGAEQASRAHDHFSSSHVQLPVESPSRCPSNRSSVAASRCLPRIHNAERS